MKTISKIMMLATLLVVVACNSNETPDLPTPEETFGTVEFSFDVKENTASDGGRKESAGRVENAEPAQIVVSIQDAAGTLVYDAHVMPLIAVNGTYITNQLSMQVGNYQITEYYVQDDLGNILYVTPQEGSNLAYLVNDPLPIDLVVTKDSNIQESPEVVSPQGATADDFGYSSFRLNIVNTIDMLVSVHILNRLTATYELTDASIQISGDSTLAYDGSLAAITNQVRVRDDFANYTVTITKAGYISYSQPFDKADLQTLESSPLYVLLGPDVNDFVVDAAINASNGGTGVVAGNFLAGEVLRIYADTEDLWGMHPTGLVANADGTSELSWTDKGFTGNVGLLVGSWDNGASFFEIGTYEDLTVPADGTLTLWCWDSLIDDNVGSITVSVQKF